MQIILLNKFNYQMFQKIKDKLKFNFLETKIRLVLPTTTVQNNQVFFNDGIPLEFIICGYRSSNLVENQNIFINDYSNYDYDLPKIIELLNEEAENMLEDKLIIISTSGVKNKITGGISLDNLEVPVIFTGPYYDNKKLIEKNYTINDVAITINNYFGVQVQNARGKIIEMQGREERD